METVIEESPDHEGRKRPVKAMTSVVTVGVLLVVAAILSAWIKQSEPTAEREAATRRSAAPVETITVEKVTSRPMLSVLGTVRPARDIVLSPRVGGQIVAVEEAFTLGGLVQAGQPMLQIDPADFEHVLIARESAMQQVQTELEIEEGQQRVAKREFELLGEDIDSENRALVLREPQIESLRAKLRAAEAAVEQARLDLERTVVRAPYAAQILDRTVELGSEVSAGDELARLVGTDEYWVIVTVPLNAIRWIELPHGDRPGARATIRHRTAWGEEESRQGRVERLIGEVDESTRLARVIVAVPDPLGDEGEPALILGSIVQVEIEAKPIQQAVRLDRDYVRQSDTVWVMREGKLRIQPVDVRFSDAEYAYIGEGLSAGDRVVTTSLATVVDGLEIRDASMPVTDSIPESADPEQERQ